MECKRWEGGWLKGIHSFNWWNNIDCEHFESTLGPTVSHWQVALTRKHHNPTINGAHFSQRPTSSSPRLMCDWRGLFSINRQNELISINREKKHRQTLTLHYTTTPWINTTPPEALHRVNRIYIPFLTIIAFFSRLILIFLSQKQITKFSG